MARPWESRRRVGSSGALGPRIAAEFVEIRDGAAEAIGGLQRIGCLRVLDCSGMGEKNVSRGEQITSHP